MMQVVHRDRSDPDDSVRPTTLSVFLIPSNGLSVIFVSTAITEIFSTASQYTSLFFRLAGEVFYRHITFDDIDMASILSGLDLDTPVAFAGGFDDTDTVWHPVAGGLGKQESKEETEDEIRDREAKNSRLECNREV